MKTIYECSQSKGIKWLTALFFLVVILAIFVELYLISKGINVIGGIIVTIVLISFADICDPRCFRL